MGLDLAWAQGLACAPLTANATLVSLSSPKFVWRLPQAMTNFGLGTLEGDRLGRRGARRPDPAPAAAAAVTGGARLCRPQPGPDPLWRGDGDGRLAGRGA